MLRYGNFVFAYRQLSRIKEQSSFREELGDAARTASGELEAFCGRKPKLLEIDQIDRDLTPYVGYLSAGQIIAEKARCELLYNAVQQVGASATWNKYIEEVTSLAGVKEHPVLLEIIQNHQKRFPGGALADFDRFLKASFDSLKTLDMQVTHVRRRATQNQDTYLTWDHMDVYFATSMRKAWEYQDLYDFVSKLMSSSDLVELCAAEGSSKGEPTHHPVRYFDPTQSFMINRINKGLVEALMLKRARCTVYSVQDTDTLGKDSELASTLAQGKPVVAYVPDPQVEKRAFQLLSEDPGTILERLRFVLYADENLSQRLSDEEYVLLGKIQDELDEFISARIWLSLPDSSATNDLKQRLGKGLEEFCHIVASSEKAVYDKREKTLREAHPLAVQVNLDTGVANGVLVVRSIPDCAKLLRRILLYDMEFDVEEKDDMWYLRERVSKCVFRVVTKDQKLSNCFWNFYLRERTATSDVK